MGGADRMREAWSRRTDEELLHAYFLEELSPDGRRVVTELVAAKVGPIDAYLKTLAGEQGEVVARIRVRGVEVDAGVKDQDLPRMRGVLVLATRGLGFLPRGHDDEPDGDGLGDRIGGLDGELVGLAGAAMRGLQRGLHPVGNVARSELPLPLLARLEPGAIWLPHDRYDAVHWGPDFGEVACAGERLLSVEPTANATASVTRWADAHGVPVSAVAPSPYLR